MGTYLELKHYTLKYKDISFIKGISFNMETSICLLGESGTGKSVLLNTLMKQQDYQTNGKVTFYLGEGNREIRTAAILDPETDKFVAMFMKRQKNTMNKNAIINLLLLNPNYIFCEDLHDILNKKEFVLLLKYLKVKQIKMFYVTNKIEDVIYFPYLIVLKNNNVAMEGNTLGVLQEEKIMKLLGYSLPFMVNLSIQLKYYGLIEKPCYTNIELERELWP